jgi:hypothetical protein
MIILEGIKGLLKSRKGTLCLIVLHCLTILAALGKIDGIAFTAGCTLISTIYCFVQHKVDLAGIPGNQGPQ